MNKPFHDPRPLVNTFGIAAVVAGLAGVFSSYLTSPVINEAFPGVYSTLWFLGLMLSGVAALAGDHMHRFEGPVLVGVGLGVGACFLISYGVLLVTIAGSFTAACFVVALAVACVFRANRIWVCTRALSEALKHQDRV